MMHVRQSVVGVVIFSHFSSYMTLQMQKKVLHLVIIDGQAVHIHA